MYYALLEIYVEIKNTLEIIQERLNLSTVINKYLSLCRFTILLTTGCVAGSVLTTETTRGINNAGDLA